MEYSREIQNHFLIREPLINDPTRKFNINMAFVDNILENPKSEFQFMDNSNEQTSNMSIITKSFNYDTFISALPQEQKEKYLALSEKIDIHDISSINQYGAELSSIISNNGNMLLESVRANNSDEIVSLTNDLLAQLDLIDIDELNTNTKWKRFLRTVPIIRNMVKSVTTIMTKYDSIKNNIDKITNKIGTSKLVALRDNSILQDIFDSNVSYINQLRELIIAAKLKYNMIVQELKIMHSNPSNYETFEISDVETFSNNLQKKIVDMETTEYVLIQNFLQIRATQQNNYLIADKADNMVNHIIPIWKNQLAISIIMNNQKNSIEAQQKITETTNKILKENAKNLKINSINVAKANETSVISLDTLKETTQTLIDTIKEVKAIHDNSEMSMQKYEEQLKLFTQQLNNAVNE